MDSFDDSKQHEGRPRASVFVGSHDRGGNKANPMASILTPVCHIDHALKGLRELGPFQPEYTQYSMVKTTQTRIPFKTVGWKPNLKRHNLEEGRIYTNNMSRSTCLEYFGSPGGQTGMIRVASKNVKYDLQHTRAVSHSPLEVGDARKNASGTSSYEYILFANANPDTYPDFIDEDGVLHVSGTEFGQYDFPEFKGGSRIIPHVYVFWGHGDWRKFLGTYDMYSIKDIKTTHLPLAKSIANKCMDVFASDVADKSQRKIMKKRALYRLWPDNMGKVLGVLYGHKSNKAAPRKIRKSPMTKMKSSFSNTQRGMRR